MVTMSKIIIKHILILVNISIQQTRKLYNFTFKWVSVKYVHIVRCHKSIL